MKISLNWLKRYIDVNLDAENLADVFTSLGFEVENIDFIGLKRQTSLVVGEIQKIDRHPNADKLSICSVFIGDDNLRQIVCGAKNFKLMDHVPVALPGTILPGDVKIEESKLRGILSSGMMCSGRELGLSNDHDGLLILSKDTEVGKILHDVINIPSDIIFDLSVTSNRGDCLSYLGIARELGSKLNLSVSFPDVTKTPIVNNDDLLKCVNVSSKDCSCYYGFCVTGINIQESPDWLVNDLNNAGMKSINNVVDICNWVMLETGNPLHAFDIKKIKNSELNVRYATDDESLVGLDNKLHNLNSNITVIADSEKPLVIAGIIGSIDAEVDDSTTDIFIESACFDHASIMLSSRNLNVSTESSYRFTHVVDAAACKSSGERALSLILKICGGEYVQYIPAKEHLNERTNISISNDFFLKKLGFCIPRDDIANILQRLGFDVRITDIGFNVVVPSFRSDVERPIDIVEECLRVYGTDKIPNLPVNITNVQRKDHCSFPFLRNVRQNLSNHDFFECYNYSFSDVNIVRNLLNSEPLVELENPLNIDQSCYRQSLLPGLLTTLKTNIQNGNWENKFFEAGKIVTKVNALPSECLAISCITTEIPLNRQIEFKKVTFLDIKKLCFDVLKSLINTDQIKLSSMGDSFLWQAEHSAEYCSLDRSGIEIKCGLLNKKSLKRYFGLKQNIWGMEIIITDAVFERNRSKNKRYKRFGIFPRVSKDISIIVDRDVQVGDVMSLLEKFSKKSINSSIEIEYISLFDIYTGEQIGSDKKALGFEISFRSEERTLTDNEVQEFFEKIQNEVLKFYEIRKLA